jgi:hypothetical protein
MTNNAKLRGRTMASAPFSYDQCSEPRRNVQGRILTSSYVPVVKNGNANYQYDGSTYNPSLSAAAHFIFRQVMNFDVPVDVNRVRYYSVNASRICTRIWYSDDKTGEFEPGQFDDKRLQCALQAYKLFVGAAHECTRLQ